MDIVSEGPTVIPGKEEKNESKHNSDLFCENCLTLFPGIVLPSLVAAFSFQLNPTHLLFFLREMINCVEV